MVAEDTLLGKLDIKMMTIDVDDEIGALARAFDRILVSLNLAMRELEREQSLIKNL